MASMGALTMVEPPVGEALGTPMLSFRSVGMTFRDGTVALEDASLEVARGELVAVVGPSGCGKSTLLRIASGLTTCTQGSVEVGVDAPGYVFQDATLLPWRTVQRNVELLAELHGLPKRERAERARHAIDLVGLNGFEGHHPIRLSGGMRMRVSLARSLTLDPELFFFDEPFGALDEITRERLNDELLRLYAERRFAGLFVTHSVAEAVYLSSRVIVMSARPGRIIGEVTVPLGYPRHPDLRFEPVFVDAAHQVSTLLRTAHQ